MANENFVDGIRGRELLKSLSALELLLVAVWCVLGLVFKLVSAGFQLVEKALGQRMKLQGPTTGAGCRDCSRGWPCFKAHSLRLSRIMPRGNSNPS